jgi:pyruvate/2-oxoglutarate/acetoin dehydrogenase E1 component/pyruvate/2-oxoglutarate dehydrogenase complex dihydrolipoamide acyltransferase (E2) component
MHRPERIAEVLNRALGTLLTRHEDLYLIGEDIEDPYGGAFRVTRGLSTAHPSRVLNTPISEGGIVGVANGLALAGDRVIVEIMFGDFAALAFDQLLNFSSKSVAMYGQQVPMRLVVRCPVGGRRGYGPTHSQSLQKHFIGVPHLSLFELSAYHDPEVVFNRALAKDQPAIVFESKSLYGSRYLGPGRIDEALRCELLADGNWAHIAPHERTGPDLVVLAPGGTADLAVGVARTMAAAGEATVHVLVPAQIYPLNVDPVLSVLRAADAIFTAEESTAGGVWGADVAATLHQRLWDDLRAPVVCLHSRDSVIPAAPHLERTVLLQEADILAALRGRRRGSRRVTLDESPAVTAASTTAAATPAAAAAAPTAPGATPTVAVAAPTAPGATPTVAVAAPTAPGATPTVASAAPTLAESGRAVVVPKLNNNDDSYVLLGWLVADGAEVAAGDAVAEVETSKAVEELPAPCAGILRHEVTTGAECRPGGRLAHIAAFEHDRWPGALSPSTGAGTSDPPGHEGPRVVSLGRGQQQVASVVSRGRREIPDAFAVYRASLDAFYGVEQAVNARGGPPLELLEVVVKLVGDLRERFPNCFAQLGPGLTELRLADQAHVGVTLDAGQGLFVPVVRAVEHRTLDEVADILADYRLRAMRGTFAEHQLTEANIVVSWNFEPGVMLVQPVIPPGLACALSVGGAFDEWIDDGTGRPRRVPAVNLALAHDHRIVNGAEAVGFLAALAALLADRQVLSGLLNDGCFPDAVEQPIPN